VKRIRIFALILVGALALAILLAKVMLGGVDRPAVAVAPGDSAASSVDSGPTSAGLGSDAGPVLPANLGSLSPEQQFRVALSAHKPTLALFHSLTCVPCVQMAATVEEVRPDYEGKVAFEDVDVYDTANTSFIRSARIQMIPTTVLVNAKGEASSRVGAMEADQLRALLNQLLTATSG
jgi:thiol-disulfide isomerase/thioredoxin